MRDEHECNYIVESGQAETCLTRELVLENAAWLAGRSHEGHAPLRRLEARLLRKG